MSKVIRSFVDTDFGQMHVRIAKPDRPLGRPLVCLHMTPQSGRDFEDFIRKASRDRLVIAPDYHGYGESDAPPETPEVTIPDYGSTIWQAMDSLGVTELDILGHHTGSKVAIEMARQQSARVSSLTLMSISIEGGKGQDLKPKAFAPLTLDEAGEGLNNWWKNLRQFYGDDVPLAVFAQQYAETLRAGSHFHWGFRAAYNYNSDLISNVEAIEAPITVICPGDDLANITPSIMPYIKHGIFVDKPTWQNGFLATQTDDAVRTVLESIDKMTATPQLITKES